MKIAFIHPDLGIGGAERLIVDAAVGLQKKGHEVCIYTAHHDTTHCFEETRDGTLDVRVRGDWMPRTTFGKLHVVWAVLRNIYCALVMVLASEQFDVVIADQVSVCIPVLRLRKHKIVFYCHFPDMLLATRKSVLKRLYRLPMDWLEQATTGLADLIMVNSNFTKSVFKETFTSIKAVPDTLYPSINFSKYDNDSPDPLISAKLAGAGPVFVSINRFERKKNVGLCIRAFARLRQQLAPPAFKATRLFVAGGYDPRVAENVEHYEELQGEARQAGLTSSDYPDASGQVIFLRSFSNEQRAALLARARAIIYTPAHEHFGIVPVEAMYARCPVIAVNNGGPLESIRHRETGFLCPGTPAAFSAAMAELARDPPLRERMGEAGRKHATDKFSLEAFSDKLDQSIAGVVSSPPAISPAWMPLAFMLLCGPWLLVLVLIAVARCFLL